MREVRVRFPFTPYAHQEAAFALCLAFRFVVLVWHRRAGKTVFAVMRLVLAAISFQGKDGRFAYLAPLRNQAKSVVWTYLLRFTAVIPGAKANETELRVDLPNGARIMLLGADNPDALLGIYLDGAVIDEVADMKPEAWSRVIRPTLSDRKGWCLFIGTPKGVNLFSELYYRAAKGDEPGWSANLQRWSDTGVIDADEIDKLKREMSEPEFAQEYDCDFAAAVDDVLLRLDDVLAAQSRTLVETQFNFAAKVLGVDVARYGGDRTCIFPRQGLAGFIPRVLRNADTMAVAAHIAQAIDDWQPDATFVDVGGYGAGVVDRLKQLKHATVPVDFGGRATDERFENKRAEMWWLMADWVKGGGMLPPGQAIAQDLTAPRYTYRNARGRLQLESKDDLRGRGLPSPDIGDALCCTFFAPVAPRRRLPDGTVLPRLEQRTVHEWEPLGGA